MARLLTSRKDGDSVTCQRDELYPGSGIEQGQPRDMIVRKRGETTQRHAFEVKSSNPEAAMAEHGTLLHCEEALRFIEQIPDPVTRSLVNMAFVHLVKKVHLEQRELPGTDLDMLFLVTSLAEFFSE